MNEEKKLPLQFEVQMDLKRGLYLKAVRRYRYPFERGIWVEVGHKKDPQIEQIIKLNRSLGLEVLIDEDNVYRALVCKD
jgi:hypothetical protein